MLSRKLWIPALLAVACAVTPFAKAATEVSLEGVKCLMVAKKDANAEKSAKWKDGKVYFCCDGCLGKFTKLDKEGKKKVAATANAQLVATKQYEQKGCPFSGGDIDKSTAIKVNGASIAFCCGNCKAKAEGLKGKEQVEKLFGEEAFKKAKFTAVKK